MAMRLSLDASTLTYQKERIAKLRDEMAQISEANRLWCRQKEDTGRSGRLGTSASKIAGDSGRVVGAHRLEKAMNKTTAIRREPSQMLEVFTALSPNPLLRTTPRVALRRPRNSQIALIRMLL